MGIIHDNRDLELFKTQGERDLSRFSDPMMLVVNCLTSGDTSRFANMAQRKSKDSTVLEIEPGDLNEFEAIKNVKVKFSDQGTIESIAMFFKNGNVEKTIFDSWSLLAQNDPKIQTMNERIGQMIALADSDPVTNLFRLKPGESSLSDTLSDPTMNPPRTSKLEFKKESVSE